MPRQTGDAGAVTRKPDDAVGSSGSPAAGGGHQTPEQAALTGLGLGGKDDAARTEDWGGGTAAPAVGGSSGGHSDQKAARGPDADGKVAGGLSRTEREGGK